MLNNVFNSISICIEVMSLEHMMFNSPKFYVSTSHKVLYYF